MGINIDDKVKCDTTLYRVMTLPTLIALLECNNFELRRICEWEDPYEVYCKLLNSEAWESDDGTGRSVTNKQSYNFYGMCFSERETDALWRIYSGNKQSICIVTNPDLVKNTLIDINPDTKGFIGKVIYDTKRWDSYEFNRNFNIIDEELHKLIPYSHCLIKRDEFSHENEVRLIVWDKEYTNVDKNYVQKSFLSIKNQTIKNIIKEVLLDPRVEDWYVDIISEYLKKYGIICKKSALYDTSEVNKIK